MSAKGRRKVQQVPSANNEKNDGRICMVLCQLIVIGIKVVQEFESLISRQEATGGVAVVKIGVQTARRRALVGKGQCLDIVRSVDMVIFFVSLEQIPGKPLANLCQVSRDSS